MRVIYLIASSLLILAVSTGELKADFFTFDLGWSGSSFGNDASAIGRITLDDSLLPNPGDATGSLAGIVTSFEMTITDASAGNGTFTLADFENWEWSTNGGTLDLSSELFGQPTNGAPWGTLGFGAAGNFILFGSTPGAPSGTMHFTMTPFGSTDNLRLTNFTPHTVPEPSWFVAWLGFGWVLSLRKNREKQPSH